MSKQKTEVVVIAISFAGFLLTVVARWWSVPVVQFPLEGHPGATVDFVLCNPMIGARGWIVRFGGAETKDSFVSGDVSKEEIESKAHVTFDGHTLVVFGPRGEQMNVPGFRP